MRRAFASGPSILTLALLLGCGGGDVEPPRPASPAVSQDPRDEADQDRLGAGKAVSGTSIGGRPFATLEETLSRVPGLQVLHRADGTLDLRVRVGTTSMSGDGPPLLVIDRLPIADVSRGLSMLDPERIDRVEVLRDASSTAMYGTQGAHGVVIITTKRGGSPGGTDAFPG